MPMTGMASLNDHDLIARVCDGCDAAADEFWHRFRPVIAGLAVRRFAMADADVEDLVNHIFSLLWADDCKVMRAWRGRARFSSYLGAIVIHHCQRQARQAGREPVVAPEELADQPDNRPDPGQVAELAADCDRLLAMVEQLSDRDRLLLKLRYHDDCSPGEIGQLLGMKPGTVRKALFDALGRLRARWQQAQGDSAGRVTPVP